MKKIIVFIWSIFPYCIQQFFIRLLISIKFSKVRIERACFFQLNDILKGNIKIGEYSFIGSGGKFYANNDASIKIGKYCSIASDVYMISYNHEYKHLAAHIYQNKKIKVKPKQTSKSISIGNDVWIGYRSTILPGVTIGNGAIIGAGSIVTKNVNPYDIVAGNPAKIIRSRFTAEKIAEIESTKWWNWSNEKILNNVDFLQGK